MDLDELEARLSAAVSECERLIGVAKAQLAEGDDKARHHDEAMRMQALAIGARMATDAERALMNISHETKRLEMPARLWWIVQASYREATGREW